MHTAAKPTKTQSITFAPRVSPQLPSQAMPAPTPQRLLLPDFFLYSLICTLELSPVTLKG